MIHAKLRPVPILETGCQQHTRAQQETPQVTAAAVPLGYVSEFSQKFPQIRVVSYTNHFQAIHLFSPDPAPNPPITGLAPLRDPQHMIGGKP
ncbi:hypothetical protein CCHR01_15300 [Colletotrichum chrysophilum]|uniref:Uncharacterized protein n=1 Tax=Colletotrichum chrysophilum TaxID=1836956 RepID=A0AAD9AAR2_9PEZI|nr:hypothetical protein CCHR01_15300 [Colletotrichum chrysophilum]